MPWAGGTGTVFGLQYMDGTARYSDGALVGALGHGRCNHRFFGKYSMFIH